MNSILLNEKWFWKTIGIFYRYHFIEKSTGIFIKKYSKNFSITINIEKYLINYGKNSYSQLEAPSLIVEHKDLVVLYCIDRLLTKKYTRNEVILVKNANFHSLPDIILIDQSNSPYLAISCYKWGKDYEDALENFKKQEGEIFNYYRNVNSDIQHLCIFSCYLDGGLPHITYSFYNMVEPNENRQLYLAGIFEDEFKPYNITPHLPETEKKRINRELESQIANFDQIKDFSIKNGEVISYTGNNQNIILPNSIKRIGIGAFWNCKSLRTIHLNEGVTRIGGDAFYKCDNLEYVNIPSTVREIGNNPFAGCPHLSIENSSPHFILDEGILYDKNMTQILHYPIKNKSAHFVIPDTVQFINKHAFFNNKFLRILEIPESIIWIENNLLSGCIIKKVNIKSPFFHAENGVLYNREKSQVFSVFDHNLKQLILPDTVQKIGKNSFFGCENLEYLHISKNVSHIGYNPFVRCFNLTLSNESTKFVIENGMLIDKKRKLVMYCPNNSVQETIEIPSNIKIIGRNSFCFCHNLKKIIIPNSVHLIERGAFASCINLEIVEIPSSVKEIEKWAFSHCTRLMKVEIPNHTKLSEYVFTESPIELIRY